jgi:hypothetical protein
MRRLNKRRLKLARCRAISPEGCDDARLFQ